MQTTALCDVTKGPDPVPKLGGGCNTVGGPCFVGQLWTVQHQFEQDA